MHKKILLTINGDLLIFEYCVKISANRLEFDNVTLILLILGVHLGSRGRHTACNVDLLHVLSEKFKIRVQLLLGWAIITGVVYTGNDPGLQKTSQLGIFVQTIVLHVYR